jgi:hypothetical protein
MARFNPFKRVVNAIRRVIAPSPPPERAPEPPRERPREHPELYTGPTERTFRRVWRQETTRKADYNKNLEVFHSMVDPIESDPDEQLELWHSYIRNMVNGEGQFRRNSSQNMWWRDSGLDPDNFSWARWREAMGFTGKRRSRTS